MATAAAAVQCGACGVDNGATAKFCKGCGHSLYESCIGCNGLVLLTQKYCGSCGADLDAAVQARHERHDTLMADSVTAAREFEFETAISLLHRVAELSDYRFAKAAGNANQAIDKVEELREQVTAKTNETLERAMQAFEVGNKAEVARLLQSVPQKLMSDEAREILARVKSFTDEVASLEGELRPAIARNDWSHVGNLLDQLIDLSPEDKQYRQLGEQVSRKLISTAQDFLSKGDYSEAIAQLNSVPRIGQGKTYARLRDLVDNVHWLSQQFDPEPFVTPMLGRLAVRFAKAVPNDQGARSLVQQLATHLKQAPRPQRTHLPAWRAPAASWMGGKAALLSLPKSVDLRDHSSLQANPCRFNVAIGLALQGLGHGRVSEHFGPKRKLLKSMGRRKEKACWGIDIGSAAMKAVCLVEAEDRLVVDDCFFEEFDAPLCRGIIQDQNPRPVELAVANFLEAKDVADAPIWVNLAASKVVNRFARLPPVKDKPAMKLLDQEIEQKIPIAADDLAIVRWMADLCPDNVHGRPAIMTAARRHVVEERLELLHRSGLMVAGMQADTLALVNFAAYEFAEYWPNDRGKNDDQLPVADDQTRAVVIVDCGATSVDLVIVSGEAHWSWTLESAGEEMTNLLARATKTTHSEAEQLKRNPAALSMPWKQYEVIEQRLDVWRLRLETAFADALKQNPRFDVVECWCAGGGSLAHQWIRRLILTK